MRAIILARVSTEEQMNEGQSIPAQLARAREYVKKKNLEIQSEHQFNESSLKDQRVKFEEIIKEINKSKEKIALIVETVDRLQRSFKESVMLDELRKQAKVELHFIRENLIIHQNSNSSEIQRWDLAVFVAKSYVLQISDNVKRTFEQKIRKGEVIGKAPIGYLNIATESGKNVILDPERSLGVRKIFDLYSTGNYSMQTIADIMAKENFRSNTREKNILKIRQIECILKNPFYYGYQLCKGQIYSHKYETIIDKNLFDQCTATRARNLNGKKKLLGNPFIFKGLVNCERCGCAITAEFKKGRYVYYHCTNYHGNCEKIYVKEEELLEPIRDMLKNIKLPAKTITELTNALKKNEESKNQFHNNQLAKLRLDHDKIDNYLSMMYQDRLDGRLSTQEYDIKINEYRDKQGQILADMERFNQANTSYYVIANKVLNLAERASHVFESSEVAEKTQLLQFLLQNLKLDGKKLSFELKSPFNMLFLYNTKTPQRSEKFLWGPIQTLNIN